MCLWLVCAFTFCTLLLKYKEIVFSFSLRKFNNPDVTKTATLVACSAGVFFGRANVLLAKTHVETRKEGRKWGESKGAGLPFLLSLIFLRHNKDGGYDSTNINKRLSPAQNIRLRCSYNFSVIPYLPRVWPWRLSEGSYKRCSYQTLLLDHRYQLRKQSQSCCTNQWILERQEPKMKEVSAVNRRQHDCRESVATRVLSRVLWWNCQ